MAKANTFDVDFEYYKANGNSVEYHDHFDNLVSAFVAFREYRMLAGEMNDEDDCKCFDVAIWVHTTDGGMHMLDRISSEDGHEWV